MILEVIDLKRSEDLLRYLSPWDSPLDLRNMAFRGHCDANFELVPSVLRLENREKIRRISQFGNPLEHLDHEFMQRTIEWSILRRFYRISDNNGLMLPIVSKFRDDINLEWSVNQGIFVESWPPSELFEISGLAQHYGLPTRLLDWTFDPFIACYFAAYGDPGPVGYLCIWCIKHALYTFKTNDRTAFDAPKESNLKFLVPPYFGNQNLSAQKGLFTVWVDDKCDSDLIKSGARTDREPLDKKIHNSPRLNWEATDGSLIYKLTLPRTESIELKRLLKDAGYGAARLFPGYGGVVKELEN